MKQEKKFLGTPVDVPRKGICPVCKESLQIWGNHKLGYRIQAHYSNDPVKKKAGENCEGSNALPIKVLV